MPQPKIEVQVLDRVPIEGMEELIADRLNCGWELTSMVPHFRYQFYVLVLTRKAMVENGMPTLLQPRVNPRPIEYVAMPTRFDNPPRVPVRDEGWETAHI